jgi:hypothetical protein
MENKKSDKQTVLKMKSNQINSTNSTLLMAEGTHRSERRKSSDNN